MRYAQARSASPGSLSRSARAASCRTLSLWQGLDKVINDYLDHITLADLMPHNEDGNDYVI